MRDNPHHMLLDPLSSWLCARLSSSTWSMRLPDFLWGAALPVAVWRLARRGLDRGPALLAAGLSALSLLHVDWSRRADFYALLPVLPALQAAAWLDLEKNPKRWAPFAAWSAVFVLAHPYGIAGLSAYGIFSYKRARGAAWLKACGVVALAFLPWFWFSSRALLDRSLFDFRGVPGLRAWDLLSRAPLSLAHAPEVGDGRAWAVSAGSALALAYLALFLAFAFGRGRSALAALCRWAVPLGVAAVVALDLRYRYYFQGRQLLVVLPFYLIGVADAAWTRLARTGRRPAALAAGLAALAAAWLPLYLDTTAVQVDLQRGFDGVVEQVGAAVKPGDSFRFAHDGLAMGFLYFYDRSAFLGAERMRLFGGTGGHLSYELPPGLTARRDGVAARVVLAPTGSGDRPEPAVWRFYGTMYDFYVDPPLRRTGESRPERPQDGRGRSGRRAGVARSGG